MHVNSFFLILGLHTVLLSSSTCDGLLFRDFITTYSSRGFVAVFTETGVHGALDRDRPVRIGHLIFAELVQTTARVDVQVARFVNLAHLARQSLFSLRSTACSCDVLGGKLQVVM